MVLIMYAVWFSAPAVLSPHLLFILYYEWALSAERWVSPWFMEKYMYIVYISGLTEPGSAPMVLKGRYLVTAKNTSDWQRVFLLLGSSISSSKDLPSGDSESPLASAWWVRKGTHVSPQKDPLRNIRNLISKNLKSALFNSNYIVFSFLTVLVAIFFALYDRH